MGIPNFIIKGNVHPRLEERLNYVSKKIWDVNVFDEYTIEAISIYFDDAVIIFDEFEIGYWIQYALKNEINISFKSTNLGILPRKIIFNESWDEICVSPLSSDVKAVEMRLTSERRKHAFDAILDEFPDFHLMDYKSIRRLLKTDDLIQAVISYGNRKNIAWEFWSSCPLCFSHFIFPIKNTTYTPVTGFLDSNDLYINCGVCDHIFLKYKIIKQEDLQHFYTNKNYARELTEENLIDYLTGISDDTTSHFRNYEVCLARAKSLLKIQSVLDIGSGMGEYSVLARRYLPGSKITAIDWHLPSSLSKLLKSKYEVDSISGNLFHSLKSMQSDSFDLITNFEVIEHLRPDDITIFVKEIYRLLKPQGICVLSTPNSKSLVAKCLDFWAAFPGEHLNVFNPQNVKSIFEKNGFKFSFIDSEAVIFRPASGWFDFGSKSKDFNSEGAANKLLDMVIKGDLCEQFRSELKRRQIGSEMILGFIK